MRNILCVAVFILFSASLWGANATPSITAPTVTIGAYGSPVSFDVYVTDVDTLPENLRLTVTALSNNSVVELAGINGKTTGSVGFSPFVATTVNNQYKSTATLTPKTTGSGSVKVTIDIYDGANHVPTQTVVSIFKSQTITFNPIHSALEDRNAIASNNRVLYATTNATYTNTNVAAPVVTFQIVSGPATIVDNNKIRISGGDADVTVKASCAGGNYDGWYSPAQAVEHTFHVTKALATITLSNLSQTYDRTVRNITATTNPSGLAVTIVYSLSGSPIAPPTSAGTYYVTATINDQMYSGSASGTFHILTRPVTVTATSATKTFNTPNPGLTYTVTGGIVGETVGFTGSLATTASTNSSVGSYDITRGTLAATGNYTINPFVVGTLEINNRITPTLTWANPAPITYGTPLGTSLRNASVGGGIAGTFEYDEASDLVLSAGQHILLIPALLK